MQGTGRFKEAVAAQTISKNKFRKLYLSAKKTPSQGFSFEFRKMFQKRFFAEHFQATPSNFVILTRNWNFI